MALMAQEMAQQQGPQQSFLAQYSQALDKYQAMQRQQAGQNGPAAGTSGVPAGTITSVPAGMMSGVPAGTMSGVPAGTMSGVPAGTMIQPASLVAPAAIPSAGDQVTIH